MLLELFIVRDEALVRAVGGILEDDGRLLRRPPSRDGDVDRPLEQLVGQLQLELVAGVELAGRQAVGVSGGADDRRPGVVSAARRGVEESSDGECAAGECDHDRIVFPCGRERQQPRVRLVIEQVVGPASSTLAAVVDLVDLRPTILSESGCEAVRAGVGSREEIEQLQAASGLKGSRR